MADTSIGDAFDVGGEGAEAPSDRLEALHKTARQLTALEIEIENREADLDALKQEATKLKSGRLPDLMAELQMPEFTHGGFTFKVHRVVNGSIPTEDHPERRAAALQWLEDHNGAGLFKTTVSVSFGKNQHNAALAVAASLRAVIKEMEMDNEVDVKSGVHSSSLASYARERIKKGEEVDADVLGLYIARVVKFDVAKKGTE